MDTEKPNYTRLKELAQEQQEADEQKNKRHFIGVPGTMPLLWHAAIELHQLERPSASARVVKLTKLRYPSNGGPKERTIGYLQTPYNSELTALMANISEITGLGVHYANLATRRAAMAKALSEPGIIILYDKDDPESTDF